ncbi:hypothetical protein [Nocardia tengchongensis]|uniref:hypothetical protein n=1 Tax=Nocardia tengchongensis TaxID=2055889 RepID=UPI0036BE2BEA
MNSDVTAAALADTDAVATPRKPKTSVVDAALVDQLVAQARASGLQLTGKAGCWDS